jgi:hypothetical protein
LAVLWGHVANKKDSAKTASYWLWCVPGVWGACGGFLRPAARVRLGGFRHVKIAAFSKVFHMNKDAFALADFSNASPLQGLLLLLLLRK